MVKSLATFFVLLLLSFNALAYPGKFSVSPDNSQELLTSTLQSAKSEIVLNAYLITSYRLNNIIIAKLKSGVIVKALVETEPYGGKIVPPQKKILDELSEAIKASGNPENKLLILNSNRGSVKRRFVFNHAKYVVVDRKYSYVSSENFVNSGAMASPDRKGNRGWQVMVEDKATAQNLLKYFTEDTSPDLKDVVAYDPALMSVVETPPPSGGDNRRSLNPIALGSGEIISSEFCAAPKAHLCMLPFLKNARETLDIQHMSLPLYWPSKGASKVLNPILVEAIAAAKRGVKVRVLINPSKEEESPAKRRPDAPPPYDSQETKDYLLQVAREQKLPLQVGIMNLQDLQLYSVHNKGMIADAKRVWVSSINGTENSVMNNREIAIDIESPEGAKYYGSVFESDWGLALK